MSPAISIIFGILLFALLIFVIVKNKKDRKDLEKDLNRDYRKPPEQEHSSDPEDLKSN
jgi:hypothetical protein